MENNRRGTEKVQNGLKSFYEQGKIEAGCDEAGRGCLAGPVFAAAVILPHDFSNTLLNDSKQLTATIRNKLRIDIERDAIAFAVARIDNEEIDKINIFKAAMKAMHLAVDQLHINPQSLLIDGNRFIPYKNIPHICIIKGDGKFASIAAASVLAKTYRDEYMENIHEEYVCYNWKKNKGYPTKEHKISIIKHGICKYHRRSFNLIDNQLSLNFL